MAELFEVTIEEYGVRRVMAALQELEPTLANELHGNYRSVLDPILRSAKNRMANRELRLKNYNKWQRRGEPGFDANLSFQPARMAQGFSLIDRFGKRTSDTTADLTLFTLINRSAPGTVYELAGVNGGAPGETFVRNITKKYGKAPRALIYTWREKRGITKVYNACKDATKIACQKVQERINNG